MGEGKGGEGVLVFGMAGIAAAAASVRCEEVWVRACYLLFFLILILGAVTTLTKLR